MAVSADELYAVVLGQGAPASLQEAKRTSRSTPWSKLEPISSLRNENSIKSPWLSGDGLTLVIQRGAAGVPEFAISRRAQRTDLWPAPQALGMQSLPAPEDRMTWPCLSADGRTLLLCLGKGDRASPLYVATRNGANEPFGNYRPIWIGEEPLMGRSPRYVEATDELYFSRDRGPGTDADLYVITGLAKHRYGFQSR